MILRPIEEHLNAPVILYALLAERTREESISHKIMPSWEQHLCYLAKKPVPYWYLIELVGGEHAGAIYLSKRREIGVAIFRKYRQKGLARQAVAMLMEKHAGAPFLANVSPENTASIALFSGMGGKVIQQTFQLPGER